MEHPCAGGLTPACFAAYPAWARQAFAYKLLHIILPKQLTKMLPRGLNLPLVPPGVVIPPGVVLPPGTIVPPGVVIPPGWAPGDPAPPGVVIPPGTTFPPGWTPGDPAPPGVVIPPGTVFPPGWTPGDPAPPGVQLPPAVSPVPPGSGAPPPLYVQPFEPGPIHRPSAGAVLKEYTVSLPITGVELTRNIDADWGAARDTLSNAQVWADQYNATNPVSTTCFGSIYTIDRLIFKFSLAGIPSGAVVISANLSLKVGNLGAYMSIIAQVSNPGWNNQGDYLSFVGDPIASAYPNAGENILNIPDIVTSQIQDHIGGDYFIMIRESDHDYMNNPPEEGVDYFADVYSDGAAPDLKPTLTLEYWA